jgi:hypothetical protein
MIVRLNLAIRLAMVEPNLLHIGLLSQDTHPALTRQSTLCECNEVEARPSDAIQTHASASYKADYDHITSSVALQSWLHTAQACSL